VVEEGGGRVDGLLVRQRGGYPGLLEKKGGQISLGRGPTILERSQLEELTFVRVPFSGFYHWDKKKTNAVKFGDGPLLHRNYRWKRERALTQWSHGPYLIRGCKSWG